MARSRGKTWDVIVVGAGPAGSATARRLGLAGFSVLLLDRAVFPRQKLCGEGLLPAGADLLAEMELLQAVRESGAVPFQGIRFYWTSGVQARIDFGLLSSQASGLILPRRVLDAVLVEAARRQPEVTFQAGFRVTGIRRLEHGVAVEGSFVGSSSTEESLPSSMTTFRAKAAVLAAGVHCGLHDRLGITRRSPRSRRYALGTCFPHLDGSGPWVEVHCSSQGEAYVAPQGDGSVRVTLLLYAAGSLRYGEPLAAFFVNKLSGFPQLRNRLARLRPEGPVEALAPLASRSDRSHGERVLLVGDAAGTVDPVTGQGMTLALQDAALASRLLAARIPRDRLSSRHLEIYSRQRDAYFVRSYRLSLLLARAVRTPFWVPPMDLLLQAFPWLDRRLAALAAGMHTVAPAAGRPG